MSYKILNKTELARHGNTYELEGYLYEHINISLILIEMSPREGPRLHSHPYEEVFVIQEGQAIFTVDSNTIEARAGQIIIVPSGLPHKFINSGEGLLRQIDVHASKQFITTWLED